MDSRIWKIFKIEMISFSNVTNRQWLIHKREYVDKSFDDVLTRARNYMCLLRRRGGASFSFVVDNVVQPRFRCVQV